MAKTLLLHWIYYNPVGHAVEAIKVAKAFHDWGGPAERA